MSDNNCPECGHLLSKNGTSCPFCMWSQEDDLAAVRLNRNNREPDYYFDEIRPDQLPGL